MGFLAPFQGLKRPHRHSPCSSALARIRGFPNSALCSPSQAFGGNCEPTSCCLLRTCRKWNSNGNNADSHQGKSLLRGPLFLSSSEKYLWSTSDQGTLFLRCRSFLLPSFSLQLPGSQFPVGGSDILFLAKQRYKNLLLAPSCSTGDGGLGTIYHLCLLPLFLNHSCWALFC